MKIFYFKKEWLIIGVVLTFVVLVHYVMAQNMYTLTVEKTGTGSGRITSDIPGIDCGDDCSESYPAGTEVMLTAHPDPGSFLISLCGSSWEDTCHITMNYSFSLTARFYAGDCGRTDDELDYTIPAKEVGDCQAIHSIRLLPGFHAEEGSIFRAYISPTDDCVDYYRAARIIRHIGTGLGSYQVDYDAYPVFPAGIEMGEHVLSKFYYDGPYTDAWGSKFFYQSYGRWDGEMYSLTSYGKDRMLGMTEDDPFTSDMIFSNGMMIDIDNSPVCPQDHESVQKQTKAALRTIGTALGSYLVDYDIYPYYPSESDLGNHVIPTFYYDGPYLDGWRMPFRYISDSESYTVTSYGKDGLPGSSGGEYDADIFMVDGWLIAP